MAGQINLSTIFQSVTERLSEQKESLNQADSYNHNHGDHMTQIFSLVQQATAKKADKPPSEQLRYASEVVQNKAESGSAKLYAQGLSNAAKNFSGSDLNPETIGVLVKSLLNVESPQQPLEAQPTSQTGELLGSLLSGLTGNSGSDDNDKNIGLDELLRGGLAFYQSKQAGDNNTDALMDALMAASPMGQSSHRSQSGKLVASTIMDFAQSFKK